MRGRVQAEKVFDSKEVAAQAQWAKHSLEHREEEKKVVAKPRSGVADQL